MSQQGVGTMIKWIKPSGSEIETGDNAATLVMAKSLGWVRAENKEKAKPAKQSKVTMGLGKAGGAKDGHSRSSN